MAELQAEVVCRWLPDTTLTYVNDGYCRLNGRQREELLGQKWLSLVPPRPGRPWRPITGRFWPSRD